MANPMLVQVGANIDDLRAQLAAGKITVQEFVGKVGELSERFTGGGTAVDRFADALGKTDSVLASAGVNLQSETRALRELAQSSSLTVSELGALGTAGLVVGTAMAAWGIGRRVAEFFELDDIIGKTTARLLGLDTGAEAAGAKADVLAKASRRAGMDIKDMALAMAINEEATNKMKAGVIAANDAIERAKGPEHNAEQIRKWNAELQLVADAGVLPQLRTDIESHAFSVSELAKTYRVSADAVQLLTREMKDEDDVHKKNAQTIKRTADELEHWHEVLDEVEIGTGNFGTVLDSIDGKIVENAEHLLAAGVAARKVGEYYGLTSTQVRALEADLKAKAKATDEATAADERAAAAAAAHNAELDEQAAATVDAFDVTNTAVLGIDTSFEGWNETVMASVDVLGDVKHAADSVTMSFSSMSEAMEAALGEDIKALTKQGYTLQEAFAIRYAQVYGAKPSIHIPDAAELAKRPHRAMGGPVDAGVAHVVGEAGPELFVPSSNGTIIPNGGGVGGTQIIQLVVDGRVLASIVNDQLERDMKQSRQWPAS